MKVKELINTLSKCHPESEVVVVAHNMPVEFTISYGGGYDGIEGVNHQSIIVHIYADALNEKEMSPEEIKQEYKEILESGAFRNVAKQIANDGSPLFW